MSVVAVNQKPLAISPISIDISPVSRTILTARVKVQEKIEPYFWKSFLGHLVNVWNSPLN